MSATRSPADAHAPRARYAKPALVEYGTVRNLTGGSLGTYGDGPGTKQKYNGGTP